RDVERSGLGSKSGWLSPIKIDEPSDPIGSDLSEVQSTGKHNWGHPQSCNALEIHYQIFGGKK
ncbi:hypothetical protein N9Y42_06590, partial [Mariniblastus sp.]|nr:hypothetical protein [Mariniblastus sp.]